MLPTLLIGLREGLEASLIVGILIAAVRRSGRTELLPRLWAGVLVAVLVSLGAGAVLTWGPYGLSFQAQEILGGGLSLFAAALVTWMVLWMGAHAATMGQELRSGLDRAMARSGAAVVVLAAVSVGREGLETALFLWATVRSTGDPVTGTVGAVLGILAAVVLVVLVMRGALRVDLGRFLRWSAILLVLVAAGVLAYGLGEFQEAGVLPGGAPAFTIPGISATGVLGSILAGVLGFTPEPTWLQVVAWAAYLLVVLPVVVRRMRTPRAPRRGAERSAPVRPVAR